MLFRIAIGYAMLFSSVSVFIYSGISIVSTNWMLPLEAFQCLLVCALVLIPASLSLIVSSKVSVFIGIFLIPVCVLIGSFAVLYISDHVFYFSNRLTLSRLCIGYAFFALCALLALNATFFFLTKRKSKIPAFAIAIMAPHALFDETQTPRNSRNELDN